MRSHRPQKSSTGVSSSRFQLPRQACTGDELLGDTGAACCQPPGGNRCVAHFHPRGDQRRPHQRYQSSASRNWWQYDRRPMMPINWQSQKHSTTRRELFAQACWHSAEVEPARWPSPDWHWRLNRHTRDEYPTRFAALAPGPKHSSLHGSSAEAKQSRAEGYLLDRGGIGHFRHGQ